MPEKIEVKAASVDGVSAMYGIGKATVRTAIRKGDLAITRVGRRVVIRIADAEKWLGTSTRRKSSQKA